MIINIIIRVSNIKTKKANDIKMTVHRLVYKSDWLLDCLEVANSLFDRSLACLEVANSIRSQQVVTSDVRCRRDRTGSRRGATITETTRAARGGQEHMRKYSQQRQPNAQHQKWRTILTVAVADKATGTEFIIEYVGQEATSRYHEFPR